MTSDLFRTYYFCNAGILFEEAQAAGKRARDSSDGDLRKPCGRHGLVSLVFAAASVEAFANDILCAANISRKEDALANCIWECCSLADEDRISLEVKYQLMKIVLNGKPFSRGASPFQDFSLMIKTRNLIMHSRPEEIDQTFDGDFIPKKNINLVNGLTTRNVLSSSYPNPNPHFQAAIDTVACADWACKAASNIILDILNSVPPCEFKRSVAKICPVENFGVDH